MSDNHFLKVVGVITEAGRVATEQAVLAGGAWSSLFLRHHNINIPQLMVRGTVCRTAPLPELLSGNAIDEEFAFRRRQDGGYTLAGHNTHHFLGPSSFRHLFKYAPLLKSFPDIALKPQAFHNPDSWTNSSKWSADKPTVFESNRVLDPPPDASSVHRLRRFFGELLFFIPVCVRV